MTTKQLLTGLTKLGHQIRVICGVGNGEDNVYETGYLKIPVLYYFCRKNGFLMGKKNKKVVEKALEGADFVHFLADFPLDRYVKKICDKKHIKNMAAFHIQPENGTSQLGLGKSKLVNSLVYTYYRKKFYKKFSDIHCPSNMIAGQLKKHHYKAKLHVISNGISDTFHPKEVSRPEKYKDKYIITMVGRISKEKRQDLVIKAIAKSKYKDKIQLILPGQGTWLRKIKRLSKRKLSVPAEIGFHKQSELLDILNYSDLYVHASDIEIEAISCMEAFACGMVPVISDSKLSATSQFALTDNNKFKAGDYKDLAKKIDYWIEHEEEKKELSKKYISYAKQFHYEICTKEMEKLFLDVYNRKDK